MRRLGILGLWATLAIAAAPASGGGTCSDRDGDGFFAGADCGTAVDCNDADPAAHPAAADLCDGFDNDCSGQVDDALECLDTCGIPNASLSAALALTTGVPSTPSIAWTGSGFGVAWHEAAQGSERIVFARLDASGRPVGSAVELDVATQARGARVVWTGSEFGVAWWGNATGAREIAFARLDAAGQPIGEVTRVTNDPGAARWPSLVWTGAEYGVAWFDDRSGAGEVYFTRLDPDGVEIGDDLQLTETGGSFPVLVWSGSGYGLAWTREVGGPSALFALLDPAGGIEVAEVTVAPGRAVSLTWTGTEYGVLWRDPQSSRNLSFSRVDAQGVPTGPSRLVIDDAVAGTTPALAWIGAEYGLAWLAAPGTATAVQFGRMIPAGAMPAEVLRVTDAAPAVSATLAWTGERFASVWVGQSGGGGELYFADVYCSCSDLDGDGFTNCEECHDADPSVNPLAGEVGCDGLNNDCDPATPDIVDADGDGYPCSSDCVDVNPYIYPGNECDSLDDACNPLTDIDDCDLDGIPDECAVFVRFQTAWATGVVRPSMIQAADLDGDGGKDLIVGSGGGSISRYPNDGSGVLGPRVFLPNQGASSVWPVDLDGDGDLDLVADSDADVVWYDNTDGAATFAGPLVIATVNGGVGRVYPADLDGDGDMDVMFSSGGVNKLAWFENLDGQAHFGAARSIATLAGTSDLLAADLDGDGDLDALSTSPPQWFENLDGQGNFGPVRAIVSGLASTSYSVDASDFDGDGDLDVVAMFFSPGSIRLFRNLDGHGDFGSGEILAEIDGGAAVLAADLDGDGDEDVLVTSLYDSYVAWFENLDHAGVFGPAMEIYHTGFGETAVAAADLDNDGDLDVMSNNQVDWDVHWFRNEGNDCNGNKVPDACEPDCNANGIVDACDLRAARSLDCNANRVPDECETGCVDDCDGDGDACDADLDCDPQDGAVWSAPGPADALTLFRNGTLATLTWLPPAHPGADAVRFDVLQSPSAADLGQAACVSADQAGTSAVDAAGSATGQLDFYLVRVRNACPGSAGALGSRSDGTPRLAAPCP